MRNKSLDEFATRLQRRTSIMKKNHALTLYIICCTLGVIACGYVAIVGIDRHDSLQPIAPIHPPVLLYDSVSATPPTHPLIPLK